MPDVVIGSLGELQFRARNFLRRRGFEVVRTDLPETNLLALHLDRVFARLATDVVLDVGAGGGDFGTLLRRNGYTGRIASFEPVSDSFGHLERNSAADPAWQAFHLALGSEDGTADINVSESRVFSSFLDRSGYSAEEFGRWSETVRTESVPVRRLDGLAGEALGGGARAHLKMDTQGFDLEVLAGASGCLDRIASIQSEVSVHPIYEGMPALSESLARFEELGFGISGLFPVSYDSNLEVVEFDCVAVRRL
jgi:FkbM family methyltransferase